MRDMNYAMVNRNVEGLTFHHSPLMIVNFSSLQKM